MIESHAFYLLPHRTASGSWHMAADAALLEWVSRGPSRVVFRTYEWERPTLSLGRSERFPEGWDELALERAGIDIVRRPTGGSAVLHLEEATFALAASIPGPWALTPRGFANAAADILSRALLACGIRGSRVRVAPSASRREARKGSLCFARSDPGEVEAAGYKVAGLASRFGRTGALCHASVPLTARSRSVAALRSGGQDEREALERNARSLGELLKSDRGADGPGGARSLAETLADGLAREIAARFAGSLLPATFEDVGIDEECACAQVRSREGGG